MNIYISGYTRENLLYYLIKEIMLLTSVLNFTTCEKKL